MAVQRDTKCTSSMVVGEHTRFAGIVGRLTIQLVLGSFATLGAILENVNPKKGCTYFIMKRIRSSCLYLSSKKTKRPWLTTWGAPWWCWRGGAARCQSLEADNRLLLLVDGAPL